MELEVQEECESQDPKDHETHSHTVVSIASNGVFMELRCDE
jgi:hypothetical protein